MEDGENGMAGYIGRARRNPALREQKQASKMR